MNAHIIFITVYVVSAVAQQVLWNCLIEDPALVLRHFLEKLTVSNRQVRHDYNNNSIMSYHIIIIYQSKIIFFAL